MKKYQVKKAVLDWRIAQSKPLMTPSLPQASKVEDG